MKLKYILPAALIATSAQAETFQTIGAIGYKDVDGVDVIAVSAQHFFADQVTNGPLDETGYLTTDSNVYAAYVDSDFSEAYTLGGEAFIGNIIVGGAYADVDTDFGDAYAFTAKAGYLFGDNTIVSATYTDPEHGSGVAHFQVEYNHTIDEDRYIGFTGLIDDEADSYTVSSDYFSKVAEQYWIRAGLEYVENDVFDTTTATGAFYFNEKTNVFAAVNNDDFFTVGAKHYFNSNISGSVSYDDYDGFDGFTVELIGQF